MAAWKWGMAEARNEKETETVLAVMAQCLQQGVSRGGKGKGRGGRWLGTCNEGMPKWGMAEERKRKGDGEGKGMGVVAMVWNLQRGEASGEEAGGGKGKEGEGAAVVWHSQRGGAHRGGAWASEASAEGSVWQAKRSRTSPSAVAPVGGGRSAGGRPAAGRRPWSPRAQHVAPPPAAPTTVSPPPPLPNSRSSHALERA